MKDAAIDLPLGRAISKPTLITLSHAVEQFAVEAGSDATVVSLFQRSAYYAPAARRYEALAGAGVTTVVGFAGDGPPADGVHARQPARGPREGEGDEPVGDGDGVAPGVGAVGGEGCAGGQRWRGRPLSVGLHPPRAPPRARHPPLEHARRRRHRVRRRLPHAHHVSV